MNQVSRAFDLPLVDLYRQGNCFVCRFELRLLETSVILAQAVFLKVPHLWLWNQELSPKLLL
jgi:hypothetical protein